MDVKKEFINKSLASIEKSLDRKIKKGTIQDSDKTKTVSQITTTLNVADARNADLVIECVPEILKLKLNAFKELDSVCGGPGTYYPGFQHIIAFYQRHCRCHQKITKGHRHTLYESGTGD